MSFFKDLLPVFKRQDIIFDRSVKAADDVYTFIFRPEAKIRWNAGSTRCLRSSTKNQQGFQAFQPCFHRGGWVHRNFNRLETNPPFKQSLLNMKPGTRVSMQAIWQLLPEKQPPHAAHRWRHWHYPFNPSSKALMRAMVLCPAQTRLVYIDSAQAYLYRDDLDRMAGAHGIEIDYLSNRDDLAASITSFAREHGNDANYFIAGSPQMTKSVSSLLRDHNIRKQNIVKDAFFGL